MQRFNGSGQLIKVKCNIWTFNKMEDLSLSFTETNLC